MTQTIQLAALALPNQAIDFRLEVCNPRGEPLSPRRIFAASTEAGIGLDEGITSTIERGGACKSVIFSGRKDLVVCEDANIIKLSVNDGYGWQPAGFGAIVTGHAAASLEDHGDLIRPFEANTEELLKASVVTGTEIYVPQDVAAIARQLTAKYRHPALLYDGTLMTNVGVRLDAPSEFAGFTLLQAFEELAKKVEEVNKQTITYGAQADGKVFFRFPTGSFAIPFDLATYRELAIDMKDLCTAVYYVIGNTPNIANYTPGAYSPRTLAYLAVPDEVAHRQNPRIRPLQPVGNAFVTRPASSVESVNFNNPQYGWDSNAAGERVLGQVATFVVTADTLGSFQIVGTYDASKKQDLAGGLPIYGAHLRYWMTPSASGGILEATVSLAFYGIREDTGGGWNTYLSVPLAYTADGKYQEVPLYFPPPARYYDDAISAWIQPVGTFAAATVNVKRTGSGGAFSISDFRFYCLDTPKLVSAARLELKSPARDPATLESIYIREGLPMGRFVPNVADIVHTGRPDGTRTLPLVETRHTFNRANGYECFVDVGNPAREGEDATLERVAAAIESRARESELKTGGRL